MRDAIERYGDAWNTPDGKARRQLLEASVTDDAELVEPRGRFEGRAAIAERLDGFTARFPGATVDISTVIDQHNDFARYGWTIVDADGRTVLEGIDVVEAADDGRLRRIVMFFGALEPSANAE